MKLDKILSIVVLVVAILVITSNLVLALDPGTISTNPSNQQVSKLGSKVVGIIQMVGSFASIGILVVLGVKYMMGSTEEKAEYKKTLLPYVIGAVFVFGAVQIAGMLFKTASNITG